MDVEIVVGLWRCWSTLRFPVRVTNRTEWGIRAVIIKGRRELREGRRESGEGRSAVQCDSAANY